MNGSAGTAVALRGATLRFGHHAIWENLDLDVAPGECLAILGPNGAGKTTLLKVMLGLLPLSAGTITVDGRPPGRGSAEAGYVAQQRVFDRDLPIRGRDLVQFGVDGHRPGLPRTRPRQVASAIAAVGAQAYADAPIGLLSGGQQQRLRIAQALAAAQRLSANPLIVLGLSVLFAIAAADGGLLASFQSNVKASVLITSLSFAIYVAARLTGPLLRDRHRRQRQPRNPPSREAAQAGPITAGAQPRHVPANAAATAGQRPSLRTPPPRQ